MRIVGQVWEHLAVEGKANRGPIKKRQESIKEADSISNTMSLGVPCDAWHDTDLGIFGMLEEGADVVCGFEYAEPCAGELIDVRYAAPFQTNIREDPRDGDLTASCEQGIDEVQSVDLVVL